jgi:hypothetical protein
MAVSRNWTAKAFNGVAGPEIVIKGEANTDKLTVVPELTKRESSIPDMPDILQLDLHNAADASPENFKLVQYNEKIDFVDQYDIIEIIFKGKPIEVIEVIEVVRKKT